MRELTWIEIDRSALIHNVRTFRKLINGKKFYGVVKANAYGHGVNLVAPVLVEAGVDGLAVHSLAEAIELRKLGIDKPILLLGYLPKSDAEEAVKNQIEVTVYNKDTIVALELAARKLKKKAYIHLKLETGTNRQGITYDQLDFFLKLILSLDNVVLKGVSTHFANIEDTTEHHYARYQLNNFLKFKNYIESFNFQNPNFHCACTAATILFPETYFDMVRIGIGLYGLWPSKETYLSWLLIGKNKIELKPVLTWKTIVAQVKEVPQGSYIGYGCTYKTTRNTKLAVLPIGYSDGYDRLLSNKAYVLIKGKRAQVRGRVCMNIIMADISDIENVQLEEEVVLIGRQNSEVISADYLASLCGTIHYEFVSRLSPRIPRVLIN